MNNVVPIETQFIQNKIYTIRDTQVMLDKDLAVLYDAKPTRLREQVRRNEKKFPIDFMFELTESEVDFIVSQNAIPSKQHLGGSLPLVFTEQGVSMLATVLRSDTAIEISIKIMRAFINMRKFIFTNANMFGRFERVEQRLSLHDENFNKLFSAIEAKEIPQKQHIFYDGQIFDAYIFVSDIIKSAKTSIKLLDNYIDESILVLFSKRDIYHFGASLKDLGKKWFAVSKMDIDSFELIGKLK